MSLREHINQRSPVRRYVTRNSRPANRTNHFFYVVMQAEQPPRRIERINRQQLERRGHHRLRILIPHQPRSLLGRQPTHRSHHPNHHRPSHPHLSGRSPPNPRCTDPSTSRQQLPHLGPHPRGQPQICPPLTTRRGSQRLTRRPRRPSSLNCRQPSAHNCPDSPPSAQCRATTAVAASTRVIVRNRSAAYPATSLSRVPSAPSPARTAGSNPADCVCPPVGNRASANINATSSGEPAAFPVAPIRTGCRAGPAGVRPQATVRSVRRRP